MTTTANTAGSGASVYVAVAGIRANLPRMTGKKLTFEERARRANLARQEQSTPEERTESARKAAQGAHAPVALARRILRAWPKLSRAERDEVRDVLRHADGLIE